MSDEQQPNPNGPQNLHRAAQMLRSFRRAKRKARLKAARQNGKSHVPRQCCRICGTMFDFAIIKVDTPVIGAICSICKQTLAEGYTAVVSMKGYAFVRHPDLKDLAGQIVPMSDENLQKIQARFDAAVKLKNNGETN